MTAAHMSLNIDPRIRDLIPPLSEDEYQRLEGSCLTEGIRDAIIMWGPPAGRPCILDGHNRYEIACANDLGFELETLNLRTLEEAQRWVVNNQLARRNLSQFARGQLALRLLDVERASARRRQGARTDIRESVPDGESGRARDKAAASFNISGRQLDKVRFLEDHADDETKARLHAGETTVGKEHKRIKAEHRKTEAKKVVESKPEPPPEGPFDVIAADPPWPYHLRREDASHRGNVPYAPMSIDDIKALPVLAMAAPDAVLWLWVTNAHLLDGSALSVVEWWEFEPKALLTWAKTSVGVGHYLRGQTEHCIVATHGKPVHELSKASTLISAPRRQHSRKPEIFYELVESTCPGSKVELFAREQREKWTAWGAERGKFDVV